VSISPAISDQKLRLPCETSSGICCADLRASRGETPAALPTASTFVLLGIPDIIHLLAKLS